MRSLNPFSVYRALKRRRDMAASAAASPLPSAQGSAVHRPLTETVYADAPLARVLIALERCAADLEAALAGYARARREAGVRPENVIVEFKRVVRRVIGFEAAASTAATDDATRRLTHRLIDLYFAA